MPEVLYPSSPEEVVSILKDADSPLNQDVRINVVFRRVGEERTPAVVKFSKIDSPVFQVKLPAGSWDFISQYFKASTWRDEPIPKIPKPGSTVKTPRQIQDARTPLESMYWLQHRITEIRKNRPPIRPKRKLKA